MRFANLFYRSFWIFLGLFTAAVLVWQILPNHSQKTILGFPGWLLSIVILQVLVVGVILLLSSKLGEGDID